MIQNTNLHYQILLYIEEIGIYGSRGKEFGWKEYAKVAYKIENEFNKTKNNDLILFIREYLEKNYTNNL